MPQRVPLLLIPVHTGYSIARDVSFCLEFVRPLFKSVRLCLFDRGFYSNELMIALDRMTVPYLIFVPKNTVVPHIGCRNCPEHDDARDLVDLRICFSMHDLKHGLKSCVMQRSSAV